MLLLQKDREALRVSAEIPSFAVDRSDMRTIFSEIIAAPCPTVSSSVGPYLGAPAQFWACAGSCLRNTSLFL